MPRCAKKRFPRTKLCARDLRHRIDIVSRVEETPIPGSLDYQHSFPAVKSNLAAAIKTQVGTPRFSGVNIDEERATHLFYVRRRTEVDRLETQNHMVRFDSRFFKILRAMINDEDPYFIVIRCIERGDVAQEASEA